MKKKKLPPDLYAEALAVLARSDILKKTVYWQDEQVEKLVHKYSEDEFDALSWEEKEAHMRECEEIMGRLNESVKEMNQLDKLYNDLRLRLQERYGKEVLPPLSGNVQGLIGPDDEVSLM